MHMYKISRGYQISYILNKFLIASFFNLGNVLITETLSCSVSSLTMIKYEIQSKDLKISKKIGTKLWQIDKLLSSND